MSNRTEQEIRESIRQNRANMSETIERIGEYVNPDRVQHELKTRAREEMEEMKFKVKHKARRTMKNLDYQVDKKSHGIWGTIKANPVPATMIGVGLAWLTANKKKAEAEHVRYVGSDRPAVEPYGYGEGGGYGYRGDVAPEYRGREGQATVNAEVRTGYEEPGVRERAREMKTEARVRAEEVGDNVRDRTEEMAARAEDVVNKTEARAKDAYETTREKASELTSRGKYQARRAEHWVESSVRENPLAAGAMAAAVGLAAGLIIPETQREHEMMGQVRDKAVREGKEKAYETAGKAKESVAQSAEHAAREVVESAFPGDNVSQNEVTEPGRL